LTGNAAHRPGKVATFPGLPLLALLLTLVSAYLFLYLSIRSVYVLDNMFLVFEYPGRVRSAYRLIEFYGEGDSGNLAGKPVDARRPLSALAEGTILNLDTATRSISPAGTRLMPLFFYPLERLEIIFRIESTASSP
jgi:hypothetical protein